LCAILGALQVVDGIHWLKLLNTTKYETKPLALAEKMEIGLSVMILGFATVMAYLSYRMSKQFGWNIYKKIGADVGIQSKVYQILIFLLAFFFFFGKFIFNFRDVPYISIFCIVSQD
jgi:hypothetical protein